MTRPSICVTRPRRTVSTSGNSGISKIIAFYGVAPSTSRDIKPETCAGYSQNTAFRLSSREHGKEPAKCARRRADRFRFPAGTDRAKTSACARCFRHGCRALRPDERSDVRRGAPRVEASVWWKFCFLRRNPAREHVQMADIAGGTGDIAFVPCAPRRGFPSAQRASHRCQYRNVACRGQAWVSEKTQHMCLSLPAMPNTCRWPITAWTFTQLPLAFVMLPIATMPWPRPGGCSNLAGALSALNFRTAKRAFDPGL